ncbi:preprotein translocase subunit SecY, partial [bacterium]|nr:preprotein translocase subunit SecY [bacterium]
MQTFLEKLRLIFHDRILRNRIFFVLGGLAIFRFLSVIPVPGMDPTKLKALLSDSSFLGFLNIFSGGGLTNLSIVMLGMGPYITASIIMQLMTVILPKLKQMYHEEGEIGRRKFTQYSRLLTVPLALLQGYGLLVLLERQGVIPNLPLTETMVNVIIVSAGALLVMWLGELISEFGIGNGSSLIIFAGIVAGVPATLSQLLITYDPSQIPLYLGFLVAAGAIVAAVVTATEAERPIPITYAKQTRGMKTYGGISTYLPIRINQAGVIPIIFALSILVFPQLIASFLAGINNAAMQAIGKGLTTFSENAWMYGTAYFALVFVFTFFYTAITFEPDTVAGNLQKNGAFIPGVRPGATTAEHIGKIVTRVTLVGAIFLGAIAVLPFVMQGLTGMSTLALGGTALLIVVSVVMDFVKKINA